MPSTRAQRPPLQVHVADAKTAKRNVTDCYRVAHAVRGIEVSILVTDPGLFSCRLWKACAYESHQNSMILDRRLPNAPFSGSYEQQQTSDLLLADKDFSFPSLPVPWPTMYNSPATNLLQQLPTCILDLLVREDIRISQCYKTYFSTVAPRLPIISQKEFLYKISRTSPGHDSYLSLLVLCMGLIVRSSLKPDESNLPGTIYYTAKSFFTILSSNGRLCLEVVQAGCLIAYYEYCQALFEAASSTIWTCTEMGYILGLHKMLSPSFSFDMADRITVESGRCVWWSIFIFERYQTLSLSLSVCVCQNVLTLF